MAEDTAKPIRLLNFVSEEQLDESKKERGERVEDGTFQRDRALYEILKENKDKKDAEFNERFKHRPPKALDEEETEFLDKLEMSKKEYERQLANEEEEQLRSFQAAVAARSVVLHEPKEAGVPPQAPTTKEQKPTGKRNPATRPFNAIIKVKTQPKKTKATEKEEKEIPGTEKPASQIDQNSLDSAKGNVTGTLASCIQLAGPTQLATAKALTSAALLATLAQGTLVLGLPPGPRLLNSICSKFPPWSS